MSSNGYLCEQFRKKGIPDMLAKAKKGRYWSYYDQSRRNYVNFFVNHDEKVPIGLWMKMSLKERLALPQHQRPQEGLDSQVC